MSWHCSLALVGAFSQAACLDGKQCARLRSIRTAEKSCFGDKKIDRSNPSQYGMTSEHSTAILGVASWISSMRASRVSHSAVQENGSLTKTIGTCGRTRSESYAKWDPDSRFWRTCQASFLHTTGEPYSGTWPRRGSMLSGTLFPLPSAAPRISENGSGYWPTPKASDGTMGLPRTSNRPLRKVTHLATAVRYWLAPTSRDWRSGKSSQETMDRNARPLRETIGGQLNPTWVEWLMGWPIGWTELKPLATDKFQSWRKQHSIG